MSNVNLYDINDYFNSMDIFLVIVYPLDTEKIFESSNFEKFITFEHP